MAYGPELASSEEVSAKRLRDEILRPILVEGMRLNYRKQFHNRIHINAAFDTACRVALEAEEVAASEEMTEGKTLDRTRINQVNQVVQVLTETVKTEKEEIATLRKEVASLRAAQQNFAPAPSPLINPS